MICLFGGSCAVVLVPGCKWQTSPQTALVARLVLASDGQVYVSVVQNGSGKPKSLKIGEKEATALGP